MVDYVPVPREMHKFHPFLNVLHPQSDGIAIQQRTAMGI